MYLTGQDLHFYFLNNYAIDVIEKFTYDFCKNRVAKKKR